MKDPSQRCNQLFTVDTKHEIIFKKKQNKSTLTYDDVQIVNLKKIIFHIKTWLLFQVYCNDPAFCGPILPCVYIAKIS